MARLREEGYEKRRATGTVGPSNEIVISLQEYDEARELFRVCRAQYHDQVRSNLIMDYCRESRSSETLRKLLSDEFAGKLPPLGSGLLADTVGVAVLIFFHHGNRLVPYLVPRSSRMPVFPGGWHVSASGAAKWPSNWSGISADFSTVFVDDLYEEIREEIGLFRTQDEKVEYLTYDERYRPYRGDFEDVNSEDIIKLQAVAFCREFLRGGKPQLFFVAYTPLEWKELTKRRLMATKVLQKMGRREEIDRRLIRMIPPLVEETNWYEAWSNELHSSGYTFELLAALHYAAQLSERAISGF
jgi:hypothetical protein